MSGYYPDGCTQEDVDYANRDSIEQHDQYGELDELRDLDCGHSGTIRNAENVRGELWCEACYLERVETIASLMGGLRSLCL